MKQSEAYLPTKFGNFRMLTYSDDKDNFRPEVVMVSEKLDTDKVVNVRIHSECMTGDLFGSLRCDCGDQLEESLRYINENEGVLIYLRQEGRGIGLINKLKAYEKQDEGYDTAEANTILGFDEDMRTYELGVEILKDLGIRNINLITNNPDKLNAFQDVDINVVNRIPVEIEACDHSLQYLKTKKDHFGHLLGEL